MRELTYESKLSPLTLFALIFIVASLGFVLVGPIIGFFLAIPFFEGSITDQLAKMSDPMSYPEFRLPLYVMQGAATLIGLALLPSLVCRKENLWLDADGHFGHDHCIHGHQFGIY